jgi:GH25 family lysozyme M1 (1,4-beta-N-acetylmuramidase)
LVVFFSVALILAIGDALAQRPLGTDASGYQPSINWTAVRNAGVIFAWSKATEGTYYTSPYFAAQEAGAKN